MEVQDRDAIGRVVTLGRIEDLGKCLAFLSTSSATEI